MPKILNTSSITIKTPSGDLLPGETLDVPQPWLDYVQKDHKGAQWFKAGLLQLVAN